MLPTIGNFILVFSISIYIIILVISAYLVHTSLSLEGNSVCVQEANDMPGLVKPWLVPSFMKAELCLF